jgi:hypothetical protein
MTRSPAGARALHALVLTTWLAGCSNDIQVAETKNSPPAAIINAPASGTAFGAGEVVEFLGVVSDPNGLEDVRTVVWTSTVDGELGDIETAAPDADGFTRLSVILSAGNHGVSLRVTDTDGASAEDSVNLSVGEASQAPSATLESPANFAEFLPGDAIDIAGTVSDPQEPAESLDVVITVTNNTTQAVEATYPVVPTPGGLAQATWTAAGQGNYRITLSVTDVDGNTATPVPEVLVVVNDPSQADQDGDLFSPASGDCDDGDATRNPGADEICDVKDNDCNGEIDDKDADNDAHVDEACTNYGGALPRTDCDDARSDVYPGAYEAQDGADNDCDGEIDNGGPAYDDDGDCWCEVGPCTGSANASCGGAVVDGDCDDEDPNLSPDQLDDPDPAYADTNCDLIDGDVLDAVFLDPIGGNDADPGTDPLAPKRTLGSAYNVASNRGIRWILISNGTMSFTAGGDQFEEGIGLAGGYDAAGGWSRSAADVPQITVPAAGKQLTGWSVPTEWQQVKVVAQDNTARGGSSVALWLSNTSGLSLVDCEIEGGDAGAGGDGSNGSRGAGGSDGRDGDNGCEDSSIFCGSCSNPQGGGGGAGCTGTSDGGGGGASGNGGGGGNAGSDGDDGPTPNPPGGGSAGAGGSSNGDPGDAGFDGGTGDAGSNGSAGSGLGTFTVGTYSVANGGTGGTGQNGAGGGGGGGGAGGGWTSFNCDTRGGGGGGGGGGGCGGTGATGGTGGGASIGMVLLNGSSVTVSGGAVRTGNGGRGGNAGAGGAGGDGGLGGSGGAGETSIINEASGPGGQGGDGGQGGRGGHGGGGGGGPTIGIHCDATSGATIAGATFSIGTPGAGGSSSGAPGTTGTTAQEDCP